MHLVVDNASNNVLAEFGSYAEAEQRRIQVIGANPELAEYIEVVDLDAAVKTFSAEPHGDREAAPA